MKLALTIGPTKLEVHLRETPAAKALFKAAPFESRAQTWGEEGYFRTPVSRTPISTDARPKLASPCNIVGAISGDPRRLGEVQSGQVIKVEKG